MDVRGKGVVVTGASRGLGKALAQVLAGRGARVLMVARGEQELRLAVEDVRRRGGVAFGHAADVARKESAHAIAAIAAELVGPVELLVQNASTLVGRDLDPDAPPTVRPAPLPLVMDTECEELERVLAVNVLAPLRIGKAVVGAMLLAGRGLVIHVSSDTAIDVYPGWGAYSASKAALDHLTRIWALELAGSGVRFLAIDPGEMDTRMHAEAIPDADRSTLADPRDVARRILGVIQREPPSGTRLAASELEAVA